MMPPAVVIVPVLALRTDDPVELPPPIAMLFALKVFVEAPTSIVELVTKINLCLRAGIGWAFPSCEPRI